MHRAVNFGVLIKTKGGNELQVLGKTDIGKVRDNNEDNFAAEKMNDIAFSVVCDGMGGTEGGEIASEIAVDTILSQVTNSYSTKMKDTAVERMLISALTAANHKIYEYSVNNGLQGMGTTAVAAVLRNSSLIIAYAGDSRAYLVSDAIEQITTDHTYLQELYKMEKITKEQMETDPRKNIITRALGVSEDIDIDTIQRNINDKDIVLLCSDGLTNCLSDDSILEICKTQPFDKLSEVLVDKANENGGTDNVTVSVILNTED